MDDVDLNLLVALDALLAEGSVTGAARRLGLSTSAMSRSLARLRAVTADPLLVRAGSGLVPTPRAIEMRDQVRELSRDVRGLLRPQAGQIDFATFDRTFTLRANEGFVALFAAALVATVSAAAPGVRLHFAPKPLKDARPLREGRIDLEIGVPGTTAPELRVRSLFHDRFVGAVRTGHPLLDAAVTAERYAAFRHVVASRQAIFTGPVDAALDELGLARQIVAVVAGFPDAMRIARGSDLVALVPRSCFWNLRDGGESLAQGLERFELPVPTQELVVSAMWHPRLNADPGHRWLRDTVIAVCREPVPAA